MTTEANAAPDVAADTATSEEIANTTPEVANPESSTEEQGQQTEKHDDSDKSLKRLQRRVDRVTAARYQAEAEAQQLRAQLAQYQQQTQPQEDAQAYKPEDIDRIANQRAQEIATVQTVAAKSNEAFSQGVKAFGESFKDSIAEVIEAAGPLIDNRGMPTSLGDAVLDSDKPAQLLHFLGQNPDIAEGLQGLTPAQLGRRIARIEADMTTPEPKASKAPKPLQPVKASAARTGPDPTDTRAWIEAENARLASRK